MPETICVVHEVREQLPNGAPDPRRLWTRPEILCETTVDSAVRMEREHLALADMRRESGVYPRQSYPYAVRNRREAVLHSNARAVPNNNEGILRFRTGLLSRERDALLASGLLERHMRDDAVLEEEPPGSNLPAGFAIDRPCRVEFIELYGKLLCLG